MAFATAKELVNSNRPWGPKFGTEQAAQDYLDKALARALENAQGCKGDRPWEIVDFGKILSKDEAWIGFEFETGFDSKDDYQKFINFLWGQDHVAIDREGTGKYPVEVAYPPIELSDMLKNGSGLLRSIKFYDAQKLKPALNPTTFTKRDVGIHIGVSTPKSRMGGGGYDLSRRLDGILTSLTNKQMDDCYGRHVLHWGTANARQGYIEFKMFRAIPTIEHVTRVQHIAAKLAELVDLLIDNPKIKQIDNLYEVFMGKQDKFKY